MPTALILILTSILTASPRIQTGSGSVEGVVVAVGTNSPVAGVNVEMRRIEGTAAAPLGPLVFASGYTSPGAIVTPNSPNPGDVFYAQTKDDGKFVFTNLKPGKYRLLAADPLYAYLPAEYGQRSPRGPGYDFALDTQQMRVRIEMAPLASVSGRVIGADGKPAPRVRVMAAEVGYQNGERVLNQVQAMQTDDQGNYRLFMLPPGRYYIGALAEGLQRRNFSVAYTQPGQFDGLNQTFARAFVSYRTDGDGQLLEDVYETVYHPGETTPWSARLLDLRPGINLAGIDISLSSGRRRALRIRGTVIDGTTGQPTRATLRAIPRISGPTTVTPTVDTDPTGAFVISGLMRGEYSIAAQVTSGASRLTAIQSITLADNDVEGLRLVVNAGLSIPGRFTLDDRETRDYRVTLVPRETRAAVNVTGGFPLMAVQPGVYRVTPSPIAQQANPDVYLRSIRFGGIEAADGTIRIDNNTAADLDVAFGSNGGVVEGRVSDSQRTPAANAMVILVPAGSTRPDLFKTATTDAAGTFRIRGVAPASYRVYAWPYLPRGMWQNTEFLRSVESIGKSITVNEGSSLNTELTLLPEMYP